MAWGVKYRLEIADLDGLIWKVDFEKDGYGGAITNLIGGAEPIAFEFSAEGDDLFEYPVRPVKATVNIYSTTSFQFIDLFAVADLDIRVRIYKGASLYFCGYILVNNYQEPYNDTPYEVSITAVDGLGYLKDLKYDDAGTPYTGRKLESQILLDILAKIGYTKFTEIVNVYEVNMADDVDDSPIDQVKIDSDLFAGKVCWEVLEHLLRKWNAVIRQKDGEFIIYRPEEMTALAYARTFTGATTKTDSTVTATHSIDRSTSPSNVHDCNGGVLMVIPAAKKVSINQDYGYKDSWIDNWEFKAETFTWGSPTNDIESWANIGTCVVETMEELGENAGVLIKSHNTFPTFAKRIDQSFGTYALATADVLLFELDFLYLNQSGANRNSVDFFVVVKSDSGSHYLYIVDDEYLGWDTSANYIQIQEDAPIGSSGWINFKRKIPGLPINGSYTIQLIGLTTSFNLYVGVKNIRIYATSDELQAMMMRPPLIRPYDNQKESFFRRDPGLIPYKEYVDFKEIVYRTYEVSNALKGVDKMYDFILGDVTDSAIANVIEQFQGALAWDINSPSGVAKAFATDYAPIYLTGGVVLTSSGDDLIFTAETAGVDFTGATTATNTSGDITGNVVNTHPNVNDTPQIDVVSFDSGNSGTADIQCNGVTKTATFNTSWLITALDFKNAFAADFLAGNVIVTNSGDTIIFTHSQGNTSFTPPTTITNTSGTLDGYVTTTQSPAPGEKRIDTITISGTDGTLDILCDGTTREASFRIDYTKQWHTRGGAENDPLIEIAAGQLANHFSRPKVMLSLPIRDLSVSDNDVHINHIGTFEDDLCQVGGVNRKFAFNRGTFKAKRREWEIDMIELV